MGKSLIEVLEENDITLTKSGERWVAPCPFHKGTGRSPSFTVYPNNTYYCFGAGCGVWGDAVKFLVEYKGMAPDAAMDYVGHDYRAKAARHVIKIRDLGKFWPLCYEVAMKYHENLKHTPGAQNYLRGRGLSDSTITKYRLGYTDGGILNIENSFEYGLAIEYGLINERGYEIMSHRITIPNIPEDGACDYMVGRTVTHAKPKYLGIRAPKPIFGLHDVWQSKVIFATEGQFDWLILREWGFPSVVIGGSFLKMTSVDILKQRNVVIIPDNDAPGYEAALKLKEHLGFNAMVLDYTSMGIKDIGEAGPIAGAREDFINIVKEQIHWSLDTSSRTLAKSFKILNLQTSSLLT